MTPFLYKFLGRPLPAVFLLVRTHLGGPGSGESPPV
jgi:hypothetical protein